MRRRRINGSRDTGNVPSLLSGRIPMAALVKTLAVAEYLSFYRAAQALGTSQSSVSSRVKALEDDLGILLFDRNTRGVRLTEAGRRFIEYVKEAMDILDHAIKTAQTHSRGEEGELRIGVYALTTGSSLERLLDQFHINYPGVRLQIIESTARRSQFMLREGRIDVAFMAKTHDFPDLNSKIVWHDRLMVMLPVRHPLTSQQEVDWRQLAEETFLVRQDGTGPQVHDLVVARSAGKWQTPNIRRFAVGRSSLLSMIAAGHGISLFVKEGALAVTGNVASLPIRDEQQPIAFSAVWLPSNHDPALLNLLSMATKMARSLPRSDPR